MIKGDYDRLKEIAKYNICAEHHSPVLVAWYGPEKTWTLRCGEDHYPDTLTRQLSLTEEYKAGEEFDEPIASNIKKSIGRRFMSDKNQKTAVSLPGVPGFDLATGELLSKDHVEALVNYAFKYSLDPYRGHVCLMYGKPYITIDGYLFYARKSKRPYSLPSRPMDTKEAALYKIKETDHGWIAEAKFLDTGEIYTGIGIITYEEMTAKSTKHPEQLRSPVVAAHPWQLGQKRAEWQALRRAFPIGEAPEARPEETPRETQHGS